MKIGSGGRPAFLLPSCRSLLFCHEEGKGKQGKGKGPLPLLPIAALFVLLELSPRLRCPSGPLFFFVFGGRRKGESWRKPSGTTIAATGLVCGRAG